LAGNICDRLLEKWIGELQLFISDSGWFKYKRMIALFAAT
jgi:hypothetical protein